MSAEVLRQAAALMRERAEAATSGEQHLGGRYDAYVLGSEGYAVMGTPREGRRARTFVARCGMNDWDTDRANAEHLAGWSPVVALAVADWLDEAADHLAVEDGDDDGLGHICPTAVEGLECSVLGQSLKVARAYLGADQ